MERACIRKIVVSIEETHAVIGRIVDPPTRKVTAAAVIQNPFAGRFVEDQEPLTHVGAELGDLLAKRALDALGVAPDGVASYGKAAIVGMNGELEHAAAILHPRLGKPVRDVVEKGEAIIPATEKMGGPGAVIDVPLHNKNDGWNFDYFDTVSTSVPDAPAADEIVVLVALADSGRPLVRVKPRSRAEVGAAATS